MLLCLERLLKPKAGPRAPSVDYCKVCRVSCTELQTYWDHLEGQKHLRKQATQMTSTQYNGGPRGAQNIHCSLCTVSCSRMDAYASHMKGTMNQNLHRRIQKSITSEPMPQSVIYTGGLDSTLRPQQSWTFTTVTIHKPQAWPAQPWCPSLLCCHAEHFSLLRQWQNSCR